MRLLAAEVRRFWSRRAVAVTLLLAALVVALLAVSAVVSTRPPSAGEIRDAQAQVEQMGDSWRAEQSACEDDPQQYFGPGASTDDCAQLEPRPEDFLGFAPLDLESERNA